MNVPLLSPSGARLQAWPCHPPCLFRLPVTCEGADSHHLTDEESEAQESSLQAPSQPVPEFKSCLSAKGGPDVPPQAFLAKIDLTA